jgi:hypothetical protein
MRMIDQCALTTYTIAHEQSDSRRRAEEYEQLDKENMEITKQVRGDVQRYQRRLAAVNAGYSVSRLRTDTSANGKQPMSIEGDASNRNALHGTQDPFVRLATWHDLATVVERILAAYLCRNKHVEYSSALVSLCIPFVFACERESDAYHCFAQLMRQLGKYKKVYLYISTYHLQ